MIKAWLMKKAPVLTLVYPPAHSDTYVKSTTKNGTSFWPYFATDPAKSLTGDGVSNCWFCEALVIANQRFHIDLGSAKAVAGVYYENSHETGTLTEKGVQNFTLWGSNEATAFAELTYATDTDWTQLTTSQSTFDQHAASDAADPKYITVTNSTAYRYYAFKFADAWGTANYMGMRRLVLQVYI